MFNFKARGGFGVMHQATSGRQLTESVSAPSQEKYTPVVKTEKLVKLQSSKDLSTAKKMGLVVSSTRNGLTSPIYQEPGNVQPPTEILHSPLFDVWKRVFKNPVKGKRIKYNMSLDPSFQKFFKGEFSITDICGNEELVVDLFSDTGRRIGEFLFTKTKVTRID